MSIVFIIMVFLHRLNRTDIIFISWLRKLKSQKYITRQRSHSQFVTDPCLDNGFSDFQFRALYDPLLYSLLPHILKWGAERGTTQNFWDQF